MSRPSKLGFQHVFVNRLSHNASFGAFNSQFQEFMTLHVTNLLFVFGEPVQIAPLSALQDCFVGVIIPRNEFNSCERSRTEERAGIKL
jgi:hypothetical protein